MKTFGVFRESLDDKLDKYVSDEIKKKKTCKIPCKCNR